MKSLPCAVCMCVLMLCLLACKPKQVASTGSKPTDSSGMVWESGIQDCHSVFLDIDPVEGTNGSTAFLATYKAQGKIAKFRFEIDSIKQAGSGKPDGFNIAIGNGAIIAEPGSDASVLLSDLKTALEAKKLPVKAKRANQLSFTCLILGQNKSRDPKGGFRGNPPGTWTATKLVFSSDSGDDDAGEVFFDFSLADHKAEFSLKDADYGNFVLAKLATVL
jgi:hypothetical protein